MCPFAALNSSFINMEVLSSVTILWSSRHLKSISTFPEPKSTFRQKYRTILNTDGSCNTLSTADAPVLIIRKTHVSAVRGLQVSRYLWKRSDPTLLLLLRTFQLNKHNKPNGLRQISVFNETTETWTCR